MPLNGLVIKNNPISIDRYGEHEDFTSYPKNDHDHLTKEKENQKANQYHFGSMNNSKC